MSITKLSRFVLSFAAAAAFCSHALATTAYLATNGDDSTAVLDDSTHPYATLSAAVARLGSDGGTVSVAVGTYKFSADVDITTPVSVIGAGTSPADVIFNENGKGLGLNHANALFRNVSLTGGKKGHGGNVSIGDNGGTVEDCVLTSGVATSWDGRGGNARINSTKGQGVLRRCVLGGGRGAQNYGGGAVWADAGALIENCLITNATCGKYGAVYVKNGCKMVNCTIAKSVSSGSDPCPVVRTETGSSVINTVMANNPVKSVWYGQSGVFVNCLADVGDPINETCLVEDYSTLFTNPDRADFSPAVNSPLRDVGSDYSKTGATSAKDLALNDRVSNDIVDIGCYEFQFSGLIGNFKMLSKNFGVPAKIEFEAACDSVVGDITYSWDFDNDGTVDLVTSETRVAWTYSEIGTYSVKMTATDGVNTLPVLHEDELTTGPGIMYVSKDNAEAAYPYGSVASAAPDIATAVASAVDGSIIRVLPDMYPVAQPIDVTCGATIVGYGETPDSVKVYNTKVVSWGEKDHSVFRINHKDALVSNLTISDGKIYFKGGNVQILENGGMVSNCVITSGYIRENNAGGANVYVEGADGIVTHCKITGGMIIDNADAKVDRATGVYMTAGRLENCLVTGNYVTAGWYSRGAVIAGGTAQVVNCTVVGNYGACADYRGIYQLGKAVVKNTVSFGNTKTVEEVTTDVPWYGTAAAFDHCATDGDAAINESCLLMTSAAFKDYANGDYVPALGGALYDTGATVENPPATDLAGKPRVQGKAIDVGCYEGKVSGLIIIIR